MKWILINKLAELTGYTEKAIERKIESGVFAEGVHYRYAPDRRIHFNVEAYEKWVESDPTGVSIRAKRPSSSASAGAARGSARP